MKNMNANGLTPKGPLSSKETKELNEFVDDLTLSNGEVIDLAGIEAHSSPDIEDVIRLKDLALNDKDLVDLTGEERRSVREEDCLLTGFADDLTLCDEDVTDLSEREIVPSESVGKPVFCASIADFADDLTLCDEDVTDLSEREVIPSESANIADFPDDLAGIDRDAIDSAETGTSWEPEKNGILLTDMADNLTLTDDEIVDLTGEERPGVAERGGILLTDMADNLTLADEDIADLDEEEPRPCPHEDHAILLTDFLSSASLGGEGMTDRVRGENVLSEDFDEIIELTDLAADVPADRAMAKPDSQERQMSETKWANRKDLSPDISGTEDTDARRDALPQGFEKIASITDIAGDNFENEDTIHADMKESLLTEGVDEIIELTALAVDVSENEETVNVDGKESVSSGGIEQTDKPTNGVADAPRDDICRTNADIRKKETVFFGENTESVHSARGTACPDDTVNRDPWQEQDLPNLPDMTENGLRSFLPGKDTTPPEAIGESASFSDVGSDDLKNKRDMIEFADDIRMDAVENMDSLCKASDHDPHQEQDLLELLDIDIEKEVESLLEEPDNTFSSNGTRVKAQDITSEDIQKEQGNIEAFLEQLVKKVVSEKIDTMVIDERRVIDVIEKAVTKERDKLVKELTGDG